jgi:hypothetical protein
MKKNILLGIALIFLIFISGCTDTSSTTETKLQSYQGLGILSFTMGVAGSSRPEITVGSQDRINLLIRNNAEGETARNIVATIDNLAPFGVIDCRGNIYEPSQSRPETDDCSNPLLSDDDEITYSQHRLSNLFKNDEFELVWAVKAPTGPQTGQMTYEHTLYATLEYDYTVDSSISLIALSQDEVNRRRNEGEEYLVSGKTINSAGDIKLDTSYTNQPLIYPSTQGSTSPEFYLRFRADNQGTGLPNGNVAVRVFIPPEIAIEESKVSSSEYDWYIKQDDENEYLEKTLSANEVVLGKTLTIPFKIGQEELDSINQNAIGEKTYNMFVEMDYHYIITSEIVVRIIPLTQ